MQEHSEFSIVRDAVMSALEPLCSAVEPESEKTILKQGSVQHLYSKISGTLRHGRSDADLLAALHPTPAVCGQPREPARQRIAELEAFDRGMYAGPVGWLGGDCAEFAVAIRSALLPAGQPPSVHLFAGVGVVAGCSGAREWRELDLKMRQYETILAPMPPAASAPNLGALWARLVVEECCRLGVTYFCVAPGSRSSPLAVAVSEHPMARVVVGIDERSLGFNALGYGRATGRPAALITSSGTAVGNLMPAVMEVRGISSYQTSAHTFVDDPRGRGRWDDWISLNRSVKFRSKNSATLRPVRLACPCWC